MSERKRFWLLLALFIVSVTLLYVANSSAGQVLLQR
jgi:hypothetical protein